MGSYFDPNWKYNPTSARQNFAGLGAYADYDFSPYLGAEAEARFLDLHTFQGIYENSYLGGLRVRVDRWRVVPFGKFLAGMGTFRFPPAFNRTGNFPAIEVGGGLDYRLTHRLKLRAELVYQNWFSFNPYPPRSGALNPEGLDVGISYRIR